MPPSRRLRVGFAPGPGQDSRSTPDGRQPQGGDVSAVWGLVLEKSPKPIDARNAFALWLGTPLAPAEELSQAAGVILPSASDLQELDGDDAKKKPSKGGGMTDKAERIRKAWPSLLDSMYYPPATFDSHKKGSLARDLKVCI